MIYNTKHDSILLEKGLETLSELITECFKVPVGVEDVERFIFSLNKSTYVIKSQEELKKMMLDKPCKYMIRKKGVEHWGRGDVIGYFNDTIGGSVGVVCLIRDTNSNVVVKVPVKEGNIQYV